MSKRKQHAPEFKAQIPQQDAGREGDLVLASAPIPHTRKPHGHRTNARHHLAFQ